MFVRRGMGCIVLMGWMRWRSEGAEMMEREKAG